MNSVKGNNYIYICLVAYIVSLLLTELFSFAQSFLLVGIITFLTIVSVFFIHQWKFIDVDHTHCIILAVIVISGFFYYYWRLPTAGNIDISRHISNVQYSSSTITLEGKLLTNPRINQKQKGRFIFQVETIIDENNQTAEKTGKVYVTAPLLQVTGLYPSMKIRLVGNLYQPQNNINPGGFNFADYLKRDGIFSGFSAKSVEVIASGNSWSRTLYLFRQRIIQTHVRYLNVPRGNLVSSMVIGSRSVDLDFELQDSFRLAGLAHTLAASGFHVSIFLGLLLYLTRFATASHRLLTIVIILFIYSAIAGFYPSILRACLMGLGGVIGLVYDRSVKVSGSLLLIAVILLLVNPIWIWDLGFQLSFLATLGLIVSLPAIIDRLDWLPPTVANLTAVPLAATIWTLPLLCFVFNYFPLYGIITNIVTTPLVLIITIGGFISAFFGLLIPIMGSAIAYVLWLPITMLIAMVNLANKLPYSSLAIGEINLIQLLIIYFIFALFYFYKPSQKYWLIIILATLLSIVLPIIHQKINLVQISILNSPSQPTIIIQNRNHNTLINLGDKANLKFTVIPFLRSQGVNRLDSLFTNNPDDILLQQLKRLIIVGSINNLQNRDINYLSSENDNLKLNIDEQRWLIINHNNDLVDNYLNQDNCDVLMWFDRTIDYQSIKNLNPKTIIVNFKVTNQSFLEYLSSQKIQLLSINNNAIQWKINKGFQIYKNE